MIMIKVHTFPLFAIRPMYLSLRYVLISYIIINIFFTII
jgi:hypothetical protein